MLVTTQSVLPRTDAYRGFCTGKLSFRMSVCLSNLGSNCLPYDFPLMDLRRVVEFLVFFLLFGQCGNFLAGPKTRIHSYVRSSKALEKAFRQTLIHLSVATCILA